MCIICFNDCVYRRDDFQIAFAQIGDLWSIMPDKVNMLALTGAIHQLHCCCVESLDKIQRSILSHTAQIQQSVIVILYSSKMFVLNLNYLYFRVPWTVQTRLSFKQ